LKADRDLNTAVDAFSVDNTSTGRNSISCLNFDQFLFPNVDKGAVQFVSQI